MLLLESQRFFLRKFLLFSITYQKSLFDPFLLLYNKSLSDLSFWEQSNLIVSLGFVSGSIGILGNKIHCSSREQALCLSSLMISKLSRNKTSTAIVWFLVTCPWSNVVSPNWNAIVQLLPRAEYNSTWSVHWCDLQHVLKSAWSMNLESHSYGARVLKVPRTFRARKAMRKTPTSLFCKVSLLICCKGNRN